MAAAPRRPAADTDPYTARVEQIVAQAPPLSGEQRARIRELIRPVIEVRAASGRAA
jgi:hypothetical protein